MPPCEHCRPSLFDYLYGLLDGSEAQELRVHLDVCPVCQAELETVRAQQKLMARAARAINEVPQFVLPSDEDKTVQPPTEAPATLPLTMPRPAWRSRWMAGWVAAAAILLIVSTLAIWYHNAESRLQDRVTARRMEQKQLDQQFAALPAKYAALKLKAIDALHAEPIQHLHVVGPAQIQPGAKGNLHIALRNLEGEPAAGMVNVKVVDPATNDVLQKAKLGVNGQARVEIDAANAKPGSNLAVSVEAERASVHETIRVAAPAYVVRIDTNKTAYEVGEVLFFRALVLDRFSLKPPTEPVLLHVKLLNEKNEVASQFAQATGAGGILAGELPIGMSFRAGSYLLELSPAAGAGVQIQTAAQQLEIVRDLQAPDVQFNQNRYLPGDAISGGFVVPGGQPMPERATLTIGNQPVPVTIQPQATAAMAAAGRGNPSANMQPGGVGAKAKDTKKSADEKNASLAKTAAQRFEFRAALPSDLPAGAKDIAFKLELDNGKSKKAYHAIVPLEPTDYAIDLFPEGGDLIAGVPNRVFYRVRSRTGQPITSDGRVILLSSKDEIVDAPYQLGLGHFEFTPNLKETYTIRITSRVKTTEISDPFAKLGIRTSGVVLHVPEAVGKQGEPIAVTLRNQGPTRRLLLVAKCRGQVLDQRWVDVAASSTKFALQTTAEARGMICVTGYEVDIGLQPVAERLVYRSPAETLSLGVTFNTRQFEPGQTLKGKVSARDEAGKAAGAWVLASVVDERFQSKPRSLSAHFMLMNEIRAGADLDNAQVILHDSAESVQMLERFLGTHGWRRFVGKNPPAPFEGEEGTDETAVIFSRENTPLEQLQKQQQEKLDAALTPVRTAAFAEQARLDLARTDAARAVQLASAERAGFADAVRTALHLALGLVLACLLLASLVLMGIGAYRMIRQHKSATVSFGSAFACLGVCLVMLMVGRTFAPIDAPMPIREQAEFAKWEQTRAKLEERLALPSARRHRVPAPPVGALAMAPTSTRPADVQAFTEKQARMLEKSDAVARRQELQRSFVLNSRGEGAGFGGNALREKLSESMRDRFNKLADKHDGKAGAETAPPIKPASVPSTDVKAPAAKKTTAAAIEREFAHKHAPNLFADTLLWSPTLWLTDGAGEVRFDLASGPATYRVLLLGHTPTGRFGFYETRLDVPAVGR